MKIYEGTPGTSIASPNFERGGRMPRLRLVLVEEVRERRSVPGPFTSSITVVILQATKLPTLFTLPNFACLQKKARNIS